GPYLTPARPGRPGTWRLPPARPAPVDHWVKWCVYPLLPLEYRLTLFHEGRHTFLVVVRAPQLGHHVPLEIQLFVQGVGQTLVKCALGIGKPFGGRLREVPGQLIETRRQRAIFHTFPDKTPLNGLFGA